MAQELTKMRFIRFGQKELRVSLKHREESNKSLREKITPIWTADKEKRTPELEALTKSLVEGRKKVREYQDNLRHLKREMRDTNRAYDLSKVK